MFLRIKPKVRYAALRHALENTLHQWTISKNLGNVSFTSTRSMGNKSASNIVDHIYRYRSRGQYRYEVVCGCSLYSAYDENRNPKNEKQRD